MTESITRTKGMVILAGLMALFAVQLIAVGGAVQLPSVSLDSVLPQLATTVGISKAIAEKALELASSWWTFAAAVALTGGVAAAILKTALKLIEKQGKAFAIAW